MYKDFDDWNGLKKHLHEEGVNCFYHEREVRWCSLGINIGFEEDGKGGSSREASFSCKSIQQATVLGGAIVCLYKK